MTALIGRLEDLGWARREPHPEDRRKVIVSLTKEAWQLGQDELTPYFDAVDGATEALTAKERAVVKRYLEALVGRVSKAPGATTTPGELAPSGEGIPSCAPSKNP